MSIKWFEAQGDDCDVAVSTRIRLARNMKGFVFPNMLEPEEALSVENTLKSALSGQNMKYLNAGELSSTHAAELVSRRLISPGFAAKKTGRGIMMTDNESKSVLFNEEDHMRIQVLKPGNDLNSAYDEAEKLECEIDKRVHFAFDETFGYLTVCPTNLGTAMRAGVMLHLPALSQSGYIENLIAMLGKLGLTIRGAYGENTAAGGGLYQVSNQVTLGLSEENSIANLKAIVVEIITREREARKALFSGIRFEDSFCRSSATLFSAKLISGAELLMLLSVMRIGISLGLLEKSSAATLNKMLFEETGNSFIKNEEPENKQRERAERVHKLWKPVFENTKNSQ